MQNIFQLPHNQFSKTQLNQVGIINFFGVIACGYDHLVNCIRGKREPVISVCVLDILQHVFVMMLIVNIGNSDNEITYIFSIFFFKHLQEIYRIIEMLYYLTKDNIIPFFFR